MIITVKEQKKAASKGAALVFLKMLEEMVTFYLPRDCFFGLWMLINPS